MQSENEKLRSLLAAARKSVAKMNEDALLESIDAALAEPVEVGEVTRLRNECADAQHKLALAANRNKVLDDECAERDRMLAAADTRLGMLRQERDEARAELAAWRGNFDGPLAFVRDHTDKAFRRGAEAMREAAAAAVYATHTTGLLAPAAVTAAVRVIRRLPTPEDK